MKDWWDSFYGWRQPVSVVDPLRLGRCGEPVRLDLVFDLFRPHPDGLALVGPDGREARWQAIARGIGADGRLDHASLYLLADVPGDTGHARYQLYLADAARPPAPAVGIRQLAPTLADGVRRLDTGAYLIEICRGTGEGHGGAKWGIRYFEEKRQGINLIHRSHNAFGGVYGPFFTPENGLVNPPAHLVIDVEPLFEGPVACRYRLHGTIPDGLRPELRGKRLEMIWTFFADSPWFLRTYLPDPYETTIDGRPCRNRITVGDEIESGKGKLLLSTYRHDGGTAWRGGDLYAEILLDCIRKLQAREPAAMARAMAKLGIDPAEDPASWHWDNYWRLFSVMEGALEGAVLEREVETIWREANRIVWSDREHNRMKYSSDFVDVSREPQQTIFPLDARKTYEYSPETGYAFVRYVNRTIPRMQIVQRLESGWVNWGTNGENEYPELPSGSTIWSAYGRFPDLAAEAARMERPAVAAAGAIERHYPL
ncbi:MAG: hypothetical protein U1E53_31965 [Dongiaceae bacterium]